MVEKMLSISRRLSRFLADQEGAVTIEFTTLVPAFVFLMVFLVDVSVVYLSHSEMYSTARDCARRMSTRELVTKQQVLDYAAQQLHLGQRAYYVEAVFGQNMRCRIVVGVGEAAVFGGFFEPFVGKALVATAIMRAETRVLSAS